MNISKKYLKILIHEALSEVDNFNPFKQSVGKSDDTAAANAAAQAEFDRLDALKKGKKVPASGSTAADYQIDHEKRMLNLIKRRDMFNSQLKQIDDQLNALGKQFVSIKKASEQLNLLNTQIKPLMDQKEKILDELKYIHSAMEESYNEFLKKYTNVLSTLKTTSKK
jgi:archaellum component FlaC